MSGVDDCLLFKTEEERHRWYNDAAKYWQVFLSLYLCFESGPPTNLTDTIVKFYYIKLRAINLFEILTYLLITLCTMVTINF